MTGKNQPLTHEEMSEATLKFHELFSVVQQQYPDASVEDQLKIMESCAKLAHKERGDKIKEEVDARFGFVKEADTTEKEVEMLFGSEYEAGINYE